MRKNKALFALLTGVLAAALFAVPATAMAETVDDDGVVHLTQADFHPEYEDTLSTRFAIAGPTSSTRTLRAGLCSRPTAT